MEPQAAAGLSNERKEWWVCRQCQKPHFGYADPQWPSNANGTREGLCAACERKQKSRAHQASAPPSLFQ